MSLEFNVLQHLKTVSTKINIYFVDFHQLLTLRSVFDLPVVFARDVLSQYEGQSKQSPSLGRVLSQPAGLYSAVCVNGKNQH